MTDPDPEVDETAVSPVAVPGGPPSARRSSAMVAAGILLSRLAGLVRERFIGAQLGVGLASDAFRAALRIPNLLQNLLGEGVLSASFIPVYARLLEEGEEEEAGSVAGAIAGLLAVVSGVLVVLGVVFAEPIASVLTSGFQGERLELTVTLTRIMFPGVGVLVLSAWCLGILNSHRHFFLSYVAPVLWNVAQIAALVTAGLLGLDATGAAGALAWGVLAGGVLQLGVQLPTVRRLARGLRLSARTDLPGVRAAVSRFVPVVAGRGVVQVSGFVDLQLASYLALGGLAALGYAQIFYLLPVSLFGMSVAASQLPELSRIAGRSKPSAGADVDPARLAAERRALRARLDDNLARIAFFVVPTAVLYVVAGDVAVAALLQVSRFGAEETRLVWLILCGYTVGLVASTASRLLQNTFYAVGDTRTPALVAVARVAVAAVVGGLLMLQLDRVVIDGTGFLGLGGLGALPAPVRPLADAVRSDEDGLLRLGALGLSLASGLSAWLELGLLRRRLRPLVGSVRIGGGALARTAAAAVAAGAVAVAARAVVDDLHPLLVAAPVTFGAAGATYLAAASALGVPEAGDLVRMVRRRLGR